MLFARFVTLNRIEPFPSIELTTGGQQFLLASARDQLEERRARFVGLQLLVLGVSAVALLLGVAGRVVLPIYAAIMLSEVITRAKIVTWRNQWDQLAQDPNVLVRSLRRWWPLLIAIYESGFMIGYLLASDDHRPMVIAVWAFLIFYSSAAVTPIAVVAVQVFVVNGLGTIGLLTHYWLTAPPQDARFVTLLTILLLASTAGTANSLISSNARHHEGQRVRADAQIAAASLEQVLEIEQLTLNSISDGLVLTDDNFRIVKLNAATTDMFSDGRLAAELKPDSLRSALDANDGIEQPLEDGRLIRIDGKPLARSLADHSYLFTIRDITERRALEIERSRSQKLKALGTLAGGIAHESNNMLMAVSGSSELLRLSLTPTEKTTRYLNTIDESVARVQGLTDQLLSFGQRTTQPRYPTSISETLASIQRFAEHTMEGRLTIRSSADDLRFSTDPMGLETALSNLLLNARDASTGEVHIEASHDNSCVRFTVTDSGIGIPSALVERVVEPFFTTKDPGKGTGLGLTVTASFAEQMGGSITLLSDEGQGTTAILELPLHELADDLADPEPLPTDLTGTHVLIVDDEPAVATVFSAQLQSLGATVSVEHDLDAAIEAVRDNEERQAAVDVVLCDVVLRGASGSRLHGLLQHAGYEKPVVLVSGNASNGRVASINNSGIATATSVLSKPISRSDLARAIFDSLPPTAP